MRKLLALAMFGAAAAPASALAQDCSAGSVTARQIGTDDYDPADLGQQVIQVSLRLTEDCTPTSVVIVPRNANTFVLQGPGTVLNSRQSDAPETIARTTSAIELSQQSLQDLADGNEVRFDLLDIDAGQFVPAGSYSTTLDIMAGNVLAGSLPVETLVSPTLQLVGDALGGTIEIDLGDLTDGASAQKSIYFRSNARVSLRIDSDNEGALVHENGNRFGRIRYGATLNGTKFNPAASAPISVSSVSGQLTEAVFAFTVAPVKNAYAGRYNDVLTLDFTAN